MSDLYIDFNKNIVALEEINDPGNLGTIIRLCDWFGFRDIICSEISSVNLNSRPFQINESNSFFYNADSLIIATGAQAKWLGIPSEKKFIGYGVSACATCDAFFYKNKLYKNIEAEKPRKFKNILRIY